MRAHVVFLGEGHLVMDITVHKKSSICKTTLFSWIYHHQQHFISKFLNRYKYNVSKVCTHMPLLKYLMHSLHAFKRHQDISY